MMTGHRPLAPRKGAAGRGRNSGTPKQGHRRELYRLAVRLAEQGVASEFVYTTDDLGTHAGLQVGPEVVHVCVLPNAYLVITSSGRVLGFTHDPGVVRDLAATAQPVPEPAS